MRTALVHDGECWAATTFLSCSVNTAFYSSWTSAEGVLMPSQERAERHGPNYRRKLSGVVTGDRSSPLCLSGGSDSDKLCRDETSVSLLL